MMSKLILSILSCLLLSFIATFSLSKSSKENWTMNITYDHTERLLDINYSLLESYLNLDSKKKFENFISKLDSEISLKDNPNPCSEARGLNTSPLLLTKYKDLRFRVTLIGANKELMLECEKYIDLRMKEFEKVNLIIAKKLLVFKDGSKVNLEDDILSEKRDARELIKRQLVDLIYESKQQESNKLENDKKTTKFSKDYILRMDSLAKSLVLIDLLKNEDESYELIDFDIMDLTLVKKVSRNLTNKKRNNFLFFISLFIILQFLVTFIIYRKTIFLKKNTRIKIKKLISKINN